MQNVLEPLIHLHRLYTYQLLTTEPWYAIHIIYYGTPHQYCTRYNLPEYKWYSSCHEFCWVPEATSTVSQQCYSAQQSRCFSSDHQLADKLCDDLWPALQPCKAFTALVWYRIDWLIDWLKPVFLSLWQQLPSSTVWILYGLRVCKSGEKVVSFAAVLPADKVVSDTLNRP